MRPKSFSMASLPFHAHSTLWPIWVSIVLTTSMLNSLSSATRIRAARASSARITVFCISSSCSICLSCASESKFSSTVHILRKLSI